MMMVTLATVGVMTMMPPSYPSSSSHLGGDVEECRGAKCGGSAREDHGEGADAQPLNDDGQG
jgi:hypothetical protein